MENFAHYYLTLCRFAGYSQGQAVFIDETPILLGELNDDELNLFKAKIVPDEPCLRHSCWQRQCERLDKADKYDVEYQSLCEDVGSTCGECQDKITINEVTTHDPKLNPSLQTDDGIHVYTPWIKRGCDLKEDEIFKLKQQQQQVEYKNTTPQNPFAIILQHVKDILRLARETAKVKDGRFFQ